MKKKMGLLLIIILVIFTQIIISDAALPYRTHSRSGLPLEFETSMLYKTEVFGKPFGREDLPGKGFHKCEDGLMKNEKGEKGEYAYLGYNYYDQKITNDRYFRSIESRGNAFDQNYSNVEWQEILSWESGRNTKDPVFNYILTTQFLRRDHQTEGKAIPGFNF